MDIIVQVDPTAALPLLNQAGVTSAIFDPQTGNNQVSTTTTVLESADLGVTTIDFPEPALPGDELTYTLTVTNYGPFAATGVVLTDSLPAEVTLLLAEPSQGTCIGTFCTLGTILAGNSAQVTLSTLVHIDDWGVITNTAQVSSDLIDA